MERAKNAKRMGGKIPVVHGDEFDDKKTKPSLV